MRCQVSWSHNISKRALRAFNSGTKSEFPAVCWFTLNSPYSGAPPSVLGDLLNGLVELCSVGGSTSCLGLLWQPHDLLTRDCRAAGAAPMGPGKRQRNKGGEVYQRNPHLGHGQDSVFQCWVLARVRRWNNSVKNTAKTFADYFGLDHGLCAHIYCFKSLVHSIQFISMKKVKKSLKVVFYEIQDN